MLIYSNDNNGAWYYEYGIRGDTIILEDYIDVCWQRNVVEGLHILTVENKRTNIKIKEQVIDKPNVNLMDRVREMVSYTKKESSTGDRFIKRIESIDLVELNRRINMVETSPMWPEVEYLVMSQETKDIFDYMGVDTGCGIINQYAGKEILLSPRLVRGEIRFLYENEVIEFS